MSELGPDARRILDLAQQARTPDADDQTRIEQRLALALGAGAGLAAVAAASLSAPAHAASASVAGATSATAAGKTWTLWLLGALIAGTGAFVGHAVLLADPPAAKHATRLPALSISAPRAPRIEPPVAAQEAPTQAAITAPLPEATAAIKEHVRKPAAHERASGDDLAADAALLHQAQSALASGDAQRAQRLLAEHHQRFAHSALDLERDALQVLTLCELGEQPAAAKLARKLLTRSPHSPARASIEGSCALK